MFCHHCFKIPISDERYDELAPKIERIHRISKNPSGVGRIRNLIIQRLGKKRTGIPIEVFSFVPIVKKSHMLVTWNIRQRMFLLQPALKKKVGPRFYPYSNVYILLQSITDENARMMGFDAPTMRPEYMMMKVLYRLRPILCDQCKKTSRQVSQWKTTSL